MIVSLIVAMDEEQGIGKHNRLPWRLSDDLRRFKRLTLGHHLIMGRKTWDSIGRALPGRTTVIITRSQFFRAQDCQVVSSLPQAIALASSRAEEEVFIIGGGQIFAQALPLAQRIYLTRIHTRAGCDTFFPPLDFSQWRILHEEVLPADTHNDHPTTFQLLEKLPLTNPSFGI